MSLTIDTNRRQLRKPSNNNKDKGAIAQECTLGETPKQNDSSPQKGKNEIRNESCFFVVVVTCAIYKAAISSSSIDGCINGTDVGPPELASIGSSDGPGNPKYLLTFEMARRLGGGERQTQWLIEGTSDAYPRTSAH